MGRLQNEHHPWGSVIIEMSFVELGLRCGCVNHHSEGSVEAYYNECP